MLRNNLRLAFRSLWKNKVSTIINVLGLTTGLASCLLILLFVGHEMSFDKFQRNGDRIARVIMEYSFEGDSSQPVAGDFTSTKVAPVFSRTFPEVEKAMRLSSAEMIVKHNDELRTESEFLFVDSTFFDMFNYELIEGNPKHALDGPKKLVLTETTAKRYFGEKSAVGQTLYLGSNAIPYEVTAIVKDYPRTSQFYFDMLGSFSSLGANQEETYFNANYTTYLMLIDQPAIAGLQSKLGPFMEKEMKGTGATIRFQLEQFDQIHLHSPYNANVANTSITYLYFILGIAGLILLIVCFTYVNLSTAKSIDRAREVGVRKVSGAGRGQLFWQFIGESFIVCALSVLVSFALAALLLPSFSALVEKQLAITSLLQPQFLAVAVAGTLLISFLAGAYPALILSGLQPVKVLKGIFRNSSSSKMIQQSLVVFQFSISILLIVSTIIIQRQLTFIQHQDLGYDREHIIQLRIDWGMTHDKVDVIKQQLLANSNVLSVARTSANAVNIVGGYSMWAGDNENEPISVNANPIDEDYVTLHGLRLIAGENISEQDMREADVEDWEQKNFHFILNESAARRLGWTPQEAIGQKMTTQRQGIVRGVVKDFNFQSMHGAIKPLVLFSASQGARLLIKVNGQNLAQTISFIGEKWKTLVPNRPFDYHFIDDDFNKLYQAEMQLGKAMNLFAGIAITLATLGLFGLSSFIVQQRTKEIGIRKVMGASIINIITVTSKNFVTLVVIAILLASPLAYLIMNQWLNGFSFKISMSVWFFVAAGVTTLLVALLTVSIHGWKASSANPVNSLRSE